MNSRPLPYQGSALPLSYNSKKWSGRRGSNPRPPAWKASALSTELLPQGLLLQVWAKMDSNHRRRKPADLQSAPFGHSGICPYFKNPLCIVFSRSILETAAKVGIFFIAPNVLQFFLEEKLKIRADACRKVLLRAVFCGWFTPSRLGLTTPPYSLYR